MGYDKVLGNLILSAFLVCATTATASELWLFEYENYEGRQFPAVASAPNLDNGNFSGRAFSARIASGQWQLCSEMYFRGRCVTLGVGDYPSPTAIGLGGGVASARDLWDYDRAGAAGGGRRDAILYEGRNLTGRMFVVDQYMANLDGTGFNDRAQSLRVERGYWIFCSDAALQGDCRTFGPGDYPSLPDGLGRRISSGRRISDDYPYRQNPNWQGR